MMGIDDQFDSDMNGDVPSFNPTHSRWPSDSWEPEEQDEDGNLLEADWKPHDSDRIVLEYFKDGRYGVWMQTDTYMLDRNLIMRYIGSYEGALEYATMAHKALGNIDQVWISDAIRWTLGDEDYDKSEDLTDGEIYWWIECECFGAYPGDEWYEEKMKEDDDD